MSEPPAHFPSKKNAKHAARLLAATMEISQVIESRLADFKASLKEQAKIRNSAPRELQREEALKILECKLGSDCRLRTESSLVGGRVGGVVGCLESRCGRGDSKDTKAKTAAAADALVAAIIDAAAEIGRRKLKRRSTPLDFKFRVPLPAIVAMLSPKNPSWSSTMERIAWGGCAYDRISVTWPAVNNIPLKKGVRPSLKLYLDSAVTATPERSDPGIILGDLMHRIVSGDAAFFTAIADSIQRAKIRKKQICARAPGKSAKAENSDEANITTENIIGKVSAPPVCVKRWNNPTRTPYTKDWFQRIKKPSHSTGIPMAVWKICQEFHRESKLPTRRDIRDGLSHQKIKCSNLRVVLNRMGLTRLKEGRRSSA